MHKALIFDLVLSRPEIHGPSIIFKIICSRSTLQIVLCIYCLMRRIYSVWSTLLPYFCTLNHKSTRASTKVCVARAEFTVIEGIACILH